MLQGAWVPGALGFKDSFISAWQGFEIHIVPVSCKLLEASLSKRSARLLTFPVCTGKVCFPVSLPTAHMETWHAHLVAQLEPWGEEGTGRRQAEQLLRHRPCQAFPGRVWKLWLLSLPRPRQA